MATASCRRVTGRVYTHYSRLITGLLLNSSGHGTSLAPPSVSRDFRTDLPDRRPWSSSMVPLDRYKMIIWGTSSSHIYASFASHEASISAEYHEAYKYGLSPMARNTSSGTELHSVLRDMEIRLLRRHTR